MGYMSYDGAYKQKTKHRLIIQNKAFLSNIYIYMYIYILAAGPALRWKNIEKKFRFF